MHTNIYTFLKVQALKVLVIFVEPSTSQDVGPSKDPNLWII